MDYLGKAQSSTFCILIFCFLTATLLFLHGTQTRLSYIFMQSIQLRILKPTGPSDHRPINLPTQKCLRVGETEKQRASVVQEAAYCHAKLAALEASSEREVTWLERKHLVELERQLSVMLTAQTERDQ